MLRKKPREIEAKRKLKGLISLIKKIIIIVLFTMILASPLLAESYNQQIPFILTADGHIGYDNIEEYIYAENKARFEYQDILIKADRIAVYHQENRLVAEGKLLLKLGDRVIEGSGLDFDYHTLTGFIVDANTNLDNVSFRGKKLSLHSTNEYNLLAENAIVTPCSLPDPHYSVQAAEVRVYPEDRIVASNLWLRIAGYRVLYLPNYTARYNPYTSEYDDITPIPAFSYNSKEGLGIGIAYPYHLSDRLTGEINADISQRGDRRLEINNTYRFTPDLSIVNKYRYQLEYEDNDIDIDNTNKLSAGFQYHPNNFDLSIFSEYDFESKNIRFYIDTAYVDDDYTLSYHNRFEDGILNRENYRITYQWRYQIDLNYRQGYNTDYTPYLRMRDINISVLGIDLESQLGLGRVSNQGVTVNKGDIDIKLARTLLSGSNYNFKFNFNTESNLYFDKQQLKINEYYNYHLAEINGLYQQEIKGDLQANYKLAYVYSWDKGNTLLNSDLGKRKQSIKPEIALRYNDKPQENSAWLINLKANYQIEEESFDSAHIRLERKLDCLSYYFELDVLDTGFSVGVNF